MKKLFNKVIVSLIMASTVACSSNSNKTSLVLDSQKEYGCNVINVFNWGEYIGTDVISNFEKMYNAKVNYSLFDSNELMYTKLLSGSKYDVIIPSDYTVERLIKEDLLQPLDKTIVKNLDLVVDAVKTLPYDENNTYTAPYMWGSVGIVYNKTKVDPKLIEEKGYDVFLDEQFKGRVYMYDSERDAFMIAFKALGYSMNTENQDEIKEAYKWLLKSKELVEPSYVTDEVIDDMANGKKDIALMYSGDASYVISQNSDMAYHEPLSGTNRWIDGVVIPKNAECPKLANEFINYTLSYEASLDTSLTVGYTPVNKEAFEKLSKGEYADNEAYIPRSGYDKDEVFKYNETLRKELSELWIKVKSN